MDWYALRGKKLSVDLLRERIELLRSAMETGERILRNGSGSQFSQDKISSSVAKLDDLEHTLVEEISELELETRIAERTIGALPETEQMIMRLRYIYAYSWEQVGAALTYSTSHCKNVHSNILKKIKDSTQ